MMAVDVEAGAPFRAGTPNVLFEGDYAHVVWIKPITMSLRWPAISHDPERNAVVL